MAYLTLARRRRLPPLVLAGPGSDWAPGRQPGRPADPGHRLPRQAGRPRAHGRLRAARPALARGGLRPAGGRGHGRGPARGLLRGLRPRRGRGRRRLPRRPARPERPRPRARAGARGPRPRRRTCAAGASSAASASTGRTPPRAPSPSTARSLAARPLVVGIDARELDRPPHRDRPLPAQPPPPLARRRRPARLLLQRPARRSTPSSTTPPSRRGALGDGCARGLAWQERLVPPAAARATGSTSSSPPPTPARSPSRARASPPSTTSPSSPHPQDFALRRRPPAAHPGGPLPAGLEPRPGLLRLHPPRARPPLPEPRREGRARPPRPRRRPARPPRRGTRPARAWGSTGPTSSPWAPSSTAAACPSCCGRPPGSRAATRGSSSTSSARTAPTRASTCRAPSAALGLGDRVRLSGFVDDAGPRRPLRRRRRRGLPVRVRGLRPPRPRGRRPGRAPRRRPRALARRDLRRRRAPRGPARRDARSRPPSTASSPTGPCASAWSAPGGTSPPATRGRRPRGAPGPRSTRPPAGERHPARGRRRRLLRGARRRSSPPCARVARARRAVPWRSSSSTTPARDGSAEAVRERHPEALVIANRGQRGLRARLQPGLAREPAPRSSLFLNPDAEVPPGAVAALVGAPGAPARGRRRGPAHAQRRRDDPGLDRPRPRAARGVPASAGSSAASRAATRAASPRPSGGHALEHEPDWVSGSCLDRPARRPRGRLRASTSGSSCTRRTPTSAAASAPRAGGSCSRPAAEVRHQLGRSMAKAPGARPPRVPPEPPAATTASTTAPLSRAALSPARRPRGPRLGARGPGRRRGATRRGPGPPRPRPRSALDHRSAWAENGPHVIVPLGLAARAPVKIAIDVRKWNDYGIGTYVRNLVRHLARLDHETTYLLFCNQADEPTLRDLAENFVPVVDGSARYGLREHLSIPLKLRRLGADLLHSPHYVRPLLCTVPTVVTIHDCIHLLFPQYLPEPDGLPLRALHDGQRRPAQRPRLHRLRGLAGRHPALLPLGRPREGPGRPERDRRRAPRRTPAPRRWSGCGSATSCAAASSSSPGT